MHAPTFTTAQAQPSEPQGPSRPGLGQTIPQVARLAQRGAARRLKPTLSSSQGVFGGSPGGFPEQPRAGRGARPDSAARRRCSGRGGAAGGPAGAEQARGSANHHLPRRDRRGRQGRKAEQGNGRGAARPFFPNRRSRVNNTSTWAGSFCATWLFAERPRGLCRRAMRGKPGRGLSWPVACVVVRASQSWASQSWASQSWAAQSWGRGHARGACPRPCPRAPTWPRARPRLCALRPARCALRPRRHHRILTLLFLREGAFAPSLRRKPGTTLCRTVKKGQRSGRGT
jgi:hypothetical protein